MTKNLYPHLSVKVDTEYVYDDLEQWYITEWGKIGSGKKFRKDQSDRRDMIGKWLIDHGYVFGRDYRHTSGTEYYFASESLATMFVLGLPK